MRGRIALSLILAVWAGDRCAAEDVVDRLDDLLTVSSADGAVRGRLSGMIELEGYSFPQPSPSLFDASGTSLFNPRLTTFVDLQAGASWYAFAQVRVDRGFDPSHDHIRARLDEYALRFTPSPEGEFSFQAGKFATVVGNWVARHGSWDNPLVTAPLPYEHLTAVWDEVAARSAATLIGWAHLVPRPVRGVPAADKYLRLPLIWGPSYATGFAISGKVGRTTYAAELKNAALSSRPESWNPDEVGWAHPTVSGRVGFVPNPMWNFGVSASDGVYLRPEAVATLPLGEALGNYRQLTFGQDLAFAWHHVQVWAEAFQARFAIPRVGVAESFAYYVEGKYKFTPQVFGAVRWNEQRFGRIPTGVGSTKWGSDVWRIDVAAGYRFTPHAQLKLQYSLQQEEQGPREFTQILSGQFLLRF